MWVSQGPRITIIPALTGESERAAQLRLQQDGLSVASLAEVRSADFPSGTVIAQEPPGSARGTEVALLVNRGEQSHYYVMPDLIGVAGARAVDLLRTRGFRVTIVGELPYPGVPAGIVLRQFPSAGFQIAAGDPISLEVSQLNGRHVRIAPSILSADFAALGAAIAAAEAGRRRPDPRRRDGRPLRAEHHHRPAGRADR